MILKYVAFILQAVFPPTVVLCIGHLTTLPRSEWSWLEYLIAAPLLGCMAIVAVLITWRMASGTFREDQYR